MMSETTIGVLIGVLSVIVCYALGFFLFLSSTKR